MQGREHERIEKPGEGGILVTMEYGQALALFRLLHLEDEQMTGKHVFQINAEVGEDGVNRAVAWRWAGEEETTEWQPPPFATLPAREGDEE
jgi:hypothetical protein